MMDLLKVSLIGRVRLNEFAEFGVDGMHSYTGYFFGTL